MSLFQILFGNSEEINRRYCNVIDENIATAFQQAKE